MLLKRIDRVRWLIIALLLGVCLRFSALGHKVYWHDEVFTSIRATGHSPSEVVSDLSDGRIVQPAELMAYRQFDATKGLQDATNALLRHPEHPPLYYFLVRFWMQWVGDSTAAVRSLSAVLSLLIFPALYWLCWELFGDTTVGTVAIALLAVSPFHLLYAQEAREYSLWTFTVVMSSASLLRALRWNQPKDWGLYTLTIIMGLYTSLFAVLPTLSQGLYVLIREGGRWTRRTKVMLLVMATAGVAYIPWIVTFATQLDIVHAQTNWLNVDEPLLSLAIFWGLHISSPFVDLGLDMTDLRIFIRLACALTFLGTALVVLVRHSPPRAWLFVLLLIGVTLIALIVPDLLLGGQRSSNSRYFVPTLIGLQIAVSFCLAHWLKHPHSRQRLLGKSLLMGLFGLGLVSCLLILKSPTWWTKWFAPETIATANFLNQQERPLLMSDLAGNRLGLLLSMSDRLNDTVRFQLAVPSHFPSIPEQGSIFVFGPHDSFHDVFREQQFTLEQVQQPGVQLSTLQVQSAPALAPKAQTKVE
ncbi:hypothetical protein C1752_00392 [Acaryochloris thomasi RCC1774]|uniref:Glycosyltransferase RgtA/B/C/D-like domain-containing protein n=1 Tax=Acaryochloris thomasi RCC1774 TaxID=1764569 RepID=A0A2W1JP30_9CYAN|nr:glycosyltransferase family 39 protein [Acaryochloris thomasi]PZD75049.1 hypothetical protein C1752_00392 [Acaryochloris thomasi RCC1774]